MVFCVVGGDLDGREACLSMLGDSAPPLLTYGDGRVGGILGDCFVEGVGVVLVGVGGVLAEEEGVTGGRMGTLGCLPALPGLFVLALGEVPLVFEAFPLVGLLLLALGDVPLVSAGLPLPGLLLVLGDVPLGSEGGLPLPGRLPALPGLLVSDGGLFCKRRKVIITPVQYTVFTRLEARGVYLLKLIYRPGF